LVLTSKSLLLAVVSEDELFADATGDDHKLARSTRSLGTGINFVGLHVPLSGE
jgi:hypothetical protein